MTNYEAGNLLLVAFSYTDIWLAAVTTILAVATAALWWATRNLVIEAKDTDRRQLRAYVSLERTGPIPNSINPGLPAFQIKIKNSGRTPAYSVKSWSGIGIHELPLIEKLRPMPSVAETDVVLGAEGESVLPIRRQRPFRPEDMATVKAGTHAIYVFGKVEYRDAFEKPHYTNFCLYVADGGPDAGLKHSHIGNDTDESE